MAGWNEPAYRARQVMDWVYRRRVANPAEMSDLPRILRERLAEEFPGRPPSVARVQGAADTTRKYLFALADGRFVESVLIPASPALYGEPSDRRTLCVSTQVGCAYGCKFCASGLDGWTRNLSPGEIVAQLLAVENAAKEKVNNLVFMGMGEPLANYANLLRTIRILNAPWGVGLGARHITISTSGLAPQIETLAAEPLQVRLAVSLHGATDAVRNEIMPVNRRYPLAVLLAACEKFSRLRKQKITFEYILIAGVNDALDQARLLASHSRRLGAKINLIPYNTVEGLSWVRPPEAVQERFLSAVKAGGGLATLRREKGHDIDAACGQLRLQTERALRTGSDAPTQSV